MFLTLLIFLHKIFTDFLEAYLLINSDPVKVITSVTYQSVHEGYINAQAYPTHDGHSVH